MEGRQVAAAIFALLAAGAAAADHMQHVPDGVLAFVHLADDADPFVAAVGAIVKDVFAELAAEIARRTGTAAPVAGIMPVPI
jgi:hypothetical protein